MATKVTKWTRERGGRKDFADPTRRSHRKLEIHLAGDDAARLRQMARCGEPGGAAEADGRRGKCEGRHDALLQKRIERLRAQLHDASLREKEQRLHPQRQEEVAPSRRVEQLRREADARQRALARARSYIQAPPTPTTPAQRAHAIHAQVVEERAVQVREKAERLRQRQEEEDKWAQIVLENRQQFEEDQWREEVLKAEKKERLKKQLDQLCQEREGRRAEEHSHLQRLRQEVETSDQVYLRYHHHLNRLAAEEKVRKREELLNEIEKVRASRLQEALKEEGEWEEDLRYSAVKRAYARRVKQRTLDKMKGKRTHAEGKSDGK